MEMRGAPLASEQVLRPDTAFYSAGHRLGSRDEEGARCHFVVTVAKADKA